MSNWFTLVYAAGDRYFETFDAISDVGVADRLHMLDMVSKCSSKEELGEGKC